MKIEEINLLGAQEILFYTLNEASPKHFLMVLEIEGKTSEQGWRNAVAAIQHAHPMLNRCIVTDGDNLVFKEISGKPIVLNTSPLKDSPVLDDVLKQEMENAFESAEGPLARIRVLYSSEKCVVIIAAHHSIADAFSIVYLLDDLLLSLSGMTPNILPLRPSLDNLLGLKNDGLAAKIIKQLGSGRKDNQDYLQDMGPLQINHFRFSEEFTSHLEKCAKENGTTVHGALQSAAALAMRTLSFESNRAAYIMSPFSVRQQVGVETDCRLFIDTKMVAVSTDEVQGFWDIARNAKEGLSDIRSTEFLNSSATQLRGLIGETDDLIQFVRDHFNFDIMLSNLGRLSLRNCSNELKVNYITGPFILSGLGNHQTVGATTFNGKLILTNTSRNLVPGLLDTIRTILEQACSK